MARAAAALDAGAPGRTDSRGCPRRADGGDAARPLAPGVREEMLALLPVLEARVDHQDHPLEEHPDVPLRVHCHYSLAEILAAFAGPYRVREGVYHHPRRQPHGPALPGPPPGRPPRPALRPGAPLRRARPHVALPVPGPGWSRRARGGAADGSYVAARWAIPMPFYRGLRLAA